MTNKGLRPKLLKSSTRIRMPTELSSQHISGPDFGLSFKLAIVKRHRLRLRLHDCRSRCLCICHSGEPGLILGPEHLRLCMHTSKRFSSGRFDSVLKAFSAR